MKRAIRLTESDLNKIVKESVNRIMEEWESPLEKAKKNRNDFDNVKKIDVSKFQKKSKKPKAGTFEDLPSFAKLKNLKNESRMLKEGLVDEGPYKECMRYIEKAISTITGIGDNGSGLNDNLVSTLYKAYYACRDTALNGRIGSFDAENGYLSAGY